MEYRTLGSTGLRVSAVCLGCMTLGREAGEDESRRIIDLFVDSGGNFLDTANVYGAGASEEVVGRAVKGRRDSLIIATKVGLHPNFTRGTPIPANEWGLSRRHIFSQIDGSLRRLGLDYIDLYQIHVRDMFTLFEETIRALDDLVTMGKVRYMGASNLYAWELMKALSISDKLGLNRFVSLQPQYSLLCRDIEREILPACRSEGVGVLTWSPLGGGFLSGKYRAGKTAPADTRIGSSAHFAKLAQDPRNFEILCDVERIAHDRGCEPSEVALAWVSQQQGVTSIIVGARTTKQLEKNLGCVGLQLTQSELDILNEASAPPKDYIQVMHSAYPRHT
jgi:aryl-alcohol dehydrogenase-like predicted oxidoreductase